MEPSVKLIIKTQAKAKAQEFARMQVLLLLVRALYASLVSLSLTSLFLTIEKILTKIVVST